MKTSEKIRKYIEENSQASGKELVEYLDTLTPRAIRKQLKNLLDSGILEKFGRPPKVFYRISTRVFAIERGIVFNRASTVSQEIQTVIENRYLYISPAGEMKSGWDGFVSWCEKTNQNPEKTAQEYVRTLRKYDRFLGKDGLIDATEKLRSTFQETFIDRLYYGDFYSIERFGKTRIGQLLLHSKNSQDRKLMRLLIDEIRPKILHLLKKHLIDGVLFIPPTVKREVQFMKEFEKRLTLPVRKINVVKIRSEVIVAQKTLSKLEDRVENARKTIVVEDTGSYKNILILDDAVGSGSTLQETAAQIRRKNLCRGTIVGFSLAGSFNGFDVISEV